MTTPEDTEPAPPPEAEWVNISDPPANRSEPDTTDEDRGRPIGQWVAGGGSVAALGGAGLFQAFGPVGLAAGAVTAAGGAAAYGYYRVRSGKARSGFKMGRTRTTRSASRLGSAGKGLGKGKGPKLSGGKGPKLGGGRGPKLGKGGGPKLGRGGGKLLGGKGAKLGGGKSGKLGGGRGSKLGGKLGRSTSRLGSAGKSGGKLLGRGGKTGLGLGKRGGKLLGGKGKAGLGRWSKSTGAGAGTLGSKFGRGAKKAGGKLGAAALHTKTGQRAGRGFGAAKAAMRSAAPGKGRWKNMHRAARTAMTSNRNPFARWSASIAAALVVLTAMAHDKWKARHPETPEAKNAAAGQEPVSDDVIHDADKPRAGKTREQKLNELKLATKEKWLRETVEAFEKIRHLCTPAEVEEHMKTRRRYEAEIDELRRLVNPAGTQDPGVINPTHIHQRRNMTAFPLAAGAAEMNAAAASHAPQSMLQVANELDQFGEVPTQVALAVRSYTMRLESDYPIHAAVVEKIQEYAIAEAQLKSIADEIGPLFRQVHAKDLERFEAPRTNEQAWDVSSV